MSTHIFRINVSTAIILTILTKLESLPTRKMFLKLQSICILKLRMIRIVFHLRFTVLNMFV
jgi:hypothetical protein